MSKDKKMSAKERFKLKQFVKNLEDHRGRGTELVTVYVPSGYDIAKIIGHLQDEQGTATNIKSSSTRKNVIDALERMIQHLKLFKQTPPNGLAAFSGNISEREGQSDVGVWSIEPPLPMNQRLYRCDKEFILEPLIEMADDENTYGMIVLDKREGTVALLKGKTIIPLASTTSAVPGKTKAGGQCLHPDTPVSMSSGDIKAIKHIQVGERVLSRKPDGSIAESTVTDAWKSRKSNLLKIRTKNPSTELVLSADHTVFTYDRGYHEVAAENVSVGDWLVLAESMPANEQMQVLPKKTYASTILSASSCDVICSRRQQFGLSQVQLAKRASLSQKSISGVERGERDLSQEALTRLCNSLGLSLDDLELTIQTKAVFPSILSESFAQLIGFFLGDGYTDNTRIGLCESRELVAKTYASLLKNNFGVSAKMRFRKDRNYYSIRANIGPMMDHFKNVFPELTDAKTSAIPKRILESPLSVKAAFLKGLFDAEGWISGGRVGVALHNKFLIQQLQTLLLQFGIIGSYLTYDNKKNPYSDNIRHTIAISDKESLVRFRDWIAFTDTKKYSLLKETIQKKSSRSHVRQLLEEGSKIRDMIESAGKNLEDYPKVNNFFRDERRISKGVFAQSVVSNCSDTQLQQQLARIVHQPFVRVQIASIEVLSGEHDVCDISVEDKNFFANGLLVHNSAQRFERLRDGAAKEFYRRVGEYAKAEFLNNQDIKGILLGGPGRSKEEFLEQGQVPQEIKDKVIATKDLSYTGEFGLQELLDLCQDVLSQEDVAEEKQIMQRFFFELSQDTGKADYGEDRIRKLIELGAVDVLLLSETLPDKLLAELESLGDNMGSETMLISKETREGSQLEKMGGIAAILRYAVEF